MTRQLEHVLSGLSARHGYTAVFVRDLGYGIYLYDIGGYIYRLRGDGTIL